MNVLASPVMRLVVAGAVSLGIASFLGLRDLITSAFRDHAETRDERSTTPPQPDSAATGPCQCGTCTDICKNCPHCTRTETACLEGQYRLVAFIPQQRRPS